MGSFDHLVKEHDRLGLLAHRLLVMAEGEPDVDALVELRTSLAIELAHHCAKEDGFVYPALIADADYQVSQIAKNFIHEFKDIATVWASYLDGWSTARIAENWDGFRAETRLMVKRLQDRIYRENNELYPLALQVGAIRLRSA